MAGTARVVPWADWAEWQRGGTCLLGGLRAGNAGALGEGQALVAGWRARGRVPLAVDATAELAGAVAAARGLLPGGAPGPARHCLRLGLAMSVVRLVNGVVAPAQKGKFARPVSGVARALGLPPVLVDIRHDATHQELPGLPLLLTAAEAALRWLEEHYWVRQGAGLRRQEAGLQAAVSALCEVFAAEAAEATGRVGSAGDSGGAGDGKAKRQKGWLKEERRRALGRLAELSPAPLGRLAASAVLDCQRLRSLAAETLSGRGDGPVGQVWGRCMEALHTHWGEGFGKSLQWEAERRAEEERRGVRELEGGSQEALEVLEALAVWAAQNRDMAREGAEPVRAPSEGPPPGCIFSGGAEKGSPPKKRFRRVVDWTPCALGNLPDAFDANGASPVLFDVGHNFQWAGEASGPFQPGSEGSGLPAAEAEGTAAPPEAGLGRETRRGGGVQGEEELHSDGGGKRKEKSEGQADEELYISLL